MSYVPCDRTADHLYGLFIAEVPQLRCFPNFHSTLSGVFAATGSVDAALDVARSFLVALDYLGVVIEPSADSAEVCSDRLKVVS